MKPNAPSKTAIVVAKSQALIGAGPESSLTMDPAAVDFANHALEIAGHGAFVRALRFKTFRRVLRGYESLMIPGLARHHVLRKQFIEARVRAALDSGIRQVVQVGAGLDSLCFRLHRDYPRVSFFELDHPATQALKLRVLRFLDPGQNLRLRQLDLSKVEPTCLDSLAKKSPAPTMIIVEGVLMYLPRETVRAWLMHWQAACRKGSHLLFTHMDGPGFHRQSAAVDAWLRFAGEPFRWHANSEDVADLLAETGWESSTSHATWKGESLHPSASGEWIQEARKPSTRIARKPDSVPLLSD